MIYMYTLISFIMKLYSTLDFEKVLEVMNLPEANND